MPPTKVQHGFFSLQNAKGKLSDSCAKYSNIACHKQTLLATNKHNLLQITSPCHKSPRLATTHLALLQITSLQFVVATNENIKLNFFCNRTALSIRSKNAKRRFPKETPFPFDDKFSPTTRFTVRHRCCDNFQDTAEVRSSRSTPLPCIPDRAVSRHIRR